MNEVMRKPVVAGLFYEGTTKALRSQIEECYTHQIGPGKLPGMPSKRLEKTLGMISPHAGYPYSGPVAAWGFQKVIEEGTPEVVVLVGPNHYGLGREVAVMPGGKWSTPLGEVEIDGSLSEELAASSASIDLDETAHRKEHSLEVQLPFLQHGYGDTFKIVAISMMSHDLEKAQEVARALARVLKGRNALIIASTDLTHYEPAARAKIKDEKVIEAIRTMNPGRVEEVILEEDVSMCGPGPVMAILAATSGMGVGKVQLLKYATSGDITGDYGSVVGYASLVIEE